MILNKCALIAAAMMTCAAAAEEIPSILSEEEADAIIAAELDAELDRKAQRRAQLLEAPALHERRIEREGETILFRRVAPPPASQSVEARPVRAERPAASGAAGNRRPQEMLTLFITTFDSETSEIRSPGHDGFSALVGTNFSGLPPMVSIETDERVHSFLSIVQQVESQTAIHQASDVERRSASNESVVFYSETGAPIPREFEEGVNLVNQHYLENQVRFESKARRTEALARARERHAAKNSNSAARKETIINFWPARESAVQ